MQTLGNFSLWCKYSSSYTFTRITELSFWSKYISYFDSAKIRNKGMRKTTTNNCPSSSTNIFDDVF